jgi:hypothetical protein
VHTTTKRFIDLLLVAPSQKLVIVIENKFHAAESIGQLDDYLTYAQKKYEGYTIIPIFLILNSDAPSHPDYWVLDYSDILDIITTQIELNRDAMSGAIFDFLSFYTAILKEELIQDDETVQLALDIYQANQAAIDLLYISHHQEYRKQPRYQTLFQQVDALTDMERNALNRIYVKKKQTIDYVFAVGSNVLREAFLSFVEAEELPEEVYKAHIRLPNFILPDWLDYQDILDEPEESYWLGRSLIIWFERTWDERLKMIIELGPIPFPNRLSFLTSLESQGVSIRPSAKMEGKKFTRFFANSLEVTDWANKQEVFEKMEQLYHHSDTKQMLKKIAQTVEAMGSENQQEEEIDQVILPARREIEPFPNEAFISFMMNLQIESNEYRLQARNGSFVVPIFRELEQAFGVTREKWWWHNSTFLCWFERLNDDRLKLVLELGPLHADNRKMLLERLEEYGLTIPAKSKLPSAKYTRLYSKGKVITNWEDEGEVYQTMEFLYNDPKILEILNILETIKRELETLATH